ncbi:MAG: DUF3391 domain-containing protein, partial [Treponema sp.]|nr:DUF3391 domain-containing protein [Treponema sp.]
MKKITVKNLHPGMIFSQPVYIEGNNILVPAGVEIRKKDIDRLVSWGIETVETEGEAVAVAAGQKKEAAGSAENTAGAPS